MDCVPPRSWRTMARVRGPAASPALKNCSTAPSWSCCGGATASSRRRREPPSSCCGRWSAAGHAPFVNARSLRASAPVSSTLGHGSDDVLKTHSFVSGASREKGRDPCSTEPNPIGSLETSPALFYLAAGCAVGSGSSCGKITGRRLPTAVRRGTRHRAPDHPPRQRTTVDAGEHQPSVATTCRRSSQSTRTAHPYLVSRYNGRC